MNHRSASRIISHLLVALSLLIIASNTQAQNVTRWIGTNGNWNDVANWDNGVPTSSSTAIIGLDAGQVVNDANVVVSGLELDGPNAELVLNGSIVVTDSLVWNQGTVGGPQELEFTGIGEINGGDLETTFENFGLVEFGTNGEFTHLRSETGGNWINRSASFVEALNGLLIGSFNAGQGAINVEPLSTFKSSGATLQTVWRYNNDGVTDIDNSLAFFFADFMQGQDAELILDEGGADFFQATEMGGLVAGTGSILNLNGPFDVEFDPGGTQIGSVESGGGLMMTPETVSNFQIGPNLTSDQLGNLGGPLQLDGILNIQALPGATLGTYTLFTYNNGFMLQVDDIQLGNVPAGFSGFLIHEPQLQEINLVVEAIDPILLGDINRDGSVNLLDVNPMIELISSGSFQVEGDINFDGQVNLLDVTGFVGLLGG